MKSLSLLSHFLRNPFFALLSACLVIGLCVGLTPDQIISTAKDGFGNIMKSLGLIIVLGTTLGFLLEKTGSTRVMAGFILKKTGERRAPLAMSLTGFIVGLPIFCDSGFIVLSGLNKNLALRSRTPIAILSVALATSLYSVHCLIPPHPGAAAAAGTIGVEYGRLILFGSLIAIPAAIAGYCWARFAGRNTPLLNETPGEAQAETTPLPSTTKAFLPVIIPIALIATKSFLSFEHVSHGLSLLLSLGDPVIALLIGIILAVAAGRNWTAATIGNLLHDAIEKAGSILVIIGAGGAFGAILAATKMGDHLSNALPLSTLGIGFPFLLAMLLKTAQGSSTVAIITAASIVKPLLPALGLAAGDGPLLCILSMGAGSMLLSHANDAYFWVIARFSGLDTKTMFKVYTTASACMGLTAMFAVYVLSRILN